MRKTGALLALGAMAGMAMIAVTADADGAREAASPRQIEIESLRRTIGSGDATASDFARLAHMLDPEVSAEEIERLLTRAADLDWIHAPQPVDPRTPVETPRGAVGPDVIVCEIGPGVTQWTSAAINGFRSYTFETRSYNNGDVEMSWDPDTQAKPLIGSNVYRLMDGRLEQVGQTWLKHGICALQQQTCGPCGFPVSCAFILNPGCSDPYSASLNGNQWQLGPRTEVNPVTAEHLIHHDIPGFSGTAGRTRMLVAKLDPALNPGAMYFVESFYLHTEDAAAGNDDNNYSYRPVNIAGEDLNITFDDVTPGMETRQMLPAIYAWQEFDPDVFITTIDVPNDGRLLVGSRVWSNGDGAWRYEYVVQNCNSDRGVGSFTAPIGAGVNVSDTYFNDSHYWDGDGPGGISQSQIDWIESVAGDACVWTVDTQTVENPPRGPNILRFGTAYSFAFVADQPPAKRDAVLELFDPGSPESIAAQVWAPQACTGDLTDDGMVGPADLAQLLGAWGTSIINADLDGDSVVAPQDLGLLLGSWGPCP